MVNQTQTIELGQKLTLTQKVYDHIRSEIISTKLQPGAIIKEKDYADLFGVSRTPVHEAVSRLAEDGLVRTYPQRGTFVAPIQVVDVLDARFLRLSVEVAVVRILAEKQDANIAKKLWEIIEDQETAIRRQNMELFYELDEVFHAYMVDASGHPTLWKVINRNKAHLDRVRRLSLTHSEHVDAVMIEHRAMVSAIADGNPDDAEVALIQHIGERHEVLGEIAEEFPEYFDTQMATGR